MIIIPGCNPELISFFTGTFSNLQPRLWSQQKQTKQQAGVKTYLCKTFVSFIYTTIDMLLRFKVRQTDVQEHVVLYGAAHVRIRYKKQTDQCSDFSELNTALCIHTTPLCTLQQVPLHSPVIRALERLTSDTSGGGEWCWWMNQAGTATSPTIVTNISFFLSIMCSRHCHVYKCIIMDK